MATTGLAVLLALQASGAPVELVGTLRNRNGESISGTITVIEKGPPLVVSHSPVGKTGAFRIHADTAKGLVVHARAPDHASAEELVASGTSGSVALAFLLPVGQAVEGRVVDVGGNGVPGASLRVRYHEPGRPIRTVALDSEEITAGDGRFKFRNVGAGVPFVIDVHVRSHVAVTSQQFTVNLGAGQPLEEIVLRNSGATVVASLRGADDEPSGGVAVTLIADPAGRAPEEHGSWLHYRSFGQRTTTSPLGTVRFTGVPPGRIIVRAKGRLGEVEERASVIEGQQLRLDLRAQ
ncbi:MAG: carboxypeptidase regulatory-like domain-containing protein [Acidobacteriia bacterium]|nr:carboxypeptidase regulatory-like domain-containing protein [Terriglobia bacterium]MYG03212.1 carboxypeptidase regulatory-like domain-containing protein [Terriglobia bacterium]MYK09475.1 carboxypeptidase regulatory-like domain-containing protein [Terriglobia bacterium]